jgi:hypothetical protein
MNDELKALFPWLGAESVRYEPFDNTTITLPDKDGNFTWGGEKLPVGYGFNINNEPYVYVPKSFLEKGLVKDGHQFYLPAVIAPGFNEQFQQTAKFYTPEQITELTKDTRFEREYKDSEFKGQEGVLLPKSLIAQAPTADFVQRYKIGSAENEFGIALGQLQGIGTVGGQNAFVASASGRPNAQAWFTYNSETRLPEGFVQYTEPKKEKWYQSPLGMLGIGLLTFGGLGLAGIGPLAGGSAAAGGAALGTGLTPGAAGITGLTAGTTATGIGAGAAGTGLLAPAGFALAPSLGASLGSVGGTAIPSGSPNVGLFDTAQFGQTGQTGITPGAAGQGLQVPTTPGLSSMGGGTGLAVPVTGGTVTQLGFVPTGATPVLGDPASFINNPDVLGNTVFSTDYLAAPGAAAAGLSASDLLRIANQARGLLGAGENPLVPQQQGLPQSGRGSQAVDYSGLLSLLQLQAGTPGVSSLTAPTQLRQIYQPTLLPNVLSLLG